MFESDTFSQLVSKDNATGEVVGVERFLVTVKGLDGVAVGARVMFETGQHGMVREVGAHTSLVLNLDAEDIPLGTLVVLQDNVFSVPVGESLIGRVINPLAKPLDTKGPLQFEAQWPLMFPAPSLIERNILKDQLPTGVTVVDTLFPVVQGQRIAVLGDTKTGKTSFLMQVTQSQKNTGRIVVYVVIGKRRVEIDQLVKKLHDTGAIEHTIVVVANIFDSLAQSYIAPYMACSVAEFLWRQKQRDVVIIYDDLSSHAKVYREVSLLAGSSPGRDSYPGDMFFAHSSLLERAGKLESTGKTLTALPVVMTPADDITAFLPTSIMSITDGQLIFDAATFRENIRPAVHTGLSVSRVGGRALGERQKRLMGAVLKKLSEFRQQSEYAHFGSDMTSETRYTLQLGHMIQDAFRQTPDDLFSPLEQTLLLEAVMASRGERTLNIGLLKMKVRELAPTLKNESEIDVMVSQLLEMATVVGGGQ